MPAEWPWKRVAAGSKPPAASRSLSFSPGPYRSPEGTLLPSEREECSVTPRRCHRYRSVAVFPSCYLSWKREPSTLTPAEEAQLRQESSCPGKIICGPPWTPLDPLARASCMARKHRFTERKLCSTLRMMA